MAGRVVAAGATGYYGFAGRSDEPADESSGRVGTGRGWTPVRARQFARALGRVLGRRAWLPVPAPFVPMGLGAVTDILTRGKRVVPAKATAAGYPFRVPVLDQALQDLIDGELVT